MLLPFCPSDLSVLFLLSETNPLAHNPCGEIPKLIVSVSFCRPPCGCQEVNRHRTGWGGGGQEGSLKWPQHPEPPIPIAGALCPDLPGWLPCQACSGADSRSGYSRRGPQWHKPSRAGRCIEFVFAWCKAKASGSPALWNVCGGTQGSSEEETATPPSVNPTHPCPVPLPHRRRRAGTTGSSRGGSTSQCRNFGRTGRRWCPGCPYTGLRRIHLVRQSIRPDFGPLTSAMLCDPGLPSGHVHTWGCPHTPCLPA